MAKKRTTPYIDGIVNDYIERSKTFYPGLEFGRRYSMYSGDEPSSCKFEFRFDNGILKKTPYQVRKGTRLIHYVSDIQTVFDIVKSGTIRLTTLNSKNDRHEISYLTKELKLKFSESEIEEYKKHFFCASFSKIKTTQDEDFAMWRLYGSEGKGAALVFEIDNIKDSWHHFTVGNVQYGQCKASENYHSYTKFLEDFHQKNHNSIQNSPISPTSFLAFHKNIGWQYENEVRLLSHYVYDEYTLKPDLYSHLLAEVFHSYKDGYGHYAYMELPLVGSKRFQNFKDKMVDNPKFFNRMLPQLKLVNIILGYQHTGNSWLEIEKAIEHNEAIHPGLNFRIRSSKFSDHA